MGRILRDRNSRVRVAEWLISSQIEAKKAQVTEAQMEVEKAKADLRTRGENKPKRYVWGCRLESHLGVVSLEFSLANFVISESFCS